MDRQTTSFHMLDLLCNLAKNDDIVLWIYCSAIRINTVLVRYAHPVRTKQNTKNPNAKHAVKQRYRWKRYRSMTQQNVRHFRAAGGRMTPKSVCLWRHREHGDSNKRWHQRRFEPSQETGIKKMISGSVLSELISLWFASVYWAASSIQNSVSPLVLRLQKVQEQ